MTEDFRILFVHYAHRFLWTSRRRKLPDGGGIVWVFSTQIIYRQCSSPESPTESASMLVRLSISMYNFSAVENRDELYQILSTKVKG